MKTGDKKKVLPFSKFQKIRLFSVYPILALAFAWCIVKIDTFTIDWRLLPLVLFIIAGVTHTIAIAYYYKYAKEREITRSTGIRKTGNYFLSTASTVALIGFYLMFDIFRLY
ncbi:hypothetical protein [Olivibacter domesticus]|uniref:Uncharacterized protein n=1 Tax=Olivibacter domesticus TaxID=407022 RepID=A0A1H7KQ67_OLID1|nr:hypothetical protein [Olivibacter domesticus]SEK88971.1 hypothetical protein SAMN05661044_01430 [Olivibacter domesticus]